MALLPLYIIFIISIQYETLYLTITNNREWRILKDDCQQIADIKNR